MAGVCLRMRNLCSPESGRLTSLDAASTGSIDCEALHDVQGGIAMETHVHEIDLQKISPDIRYICELETIGELCRNIRLKGQLEPIHIWFSGGSFRILDGEKRWRACRMLGLTRIRAIIIEVERDEWLC
jgi:ParB family transcriptional regulator, chromosome partitioning protein